MSAPTFSETDFLSQVLIVEPGYYTDPVAYEFTGGRGGSRKFYKNDFQWYDEFSDWLTFGTEELTFTDEKLQF